MMMGIARIAATCLVILLLSAAGLHGQDTLAAARDLYASTRPDSALKLLDRLSGASSEWAVCDRAVSLALSPRGRPHTGCRAFHRNHRCARSALPAWRGSVATDAHRLQRGKEASPAIDRAAAVHRSERCLRSEGVRVRSIRIRASHGRAERPGHGQCCEQAAAGGSSYLAAGFHDLSVKAIPPAPASQPAAAPTPVAVARPAPPTPRIYTGEERNVVPPQTLAQTLPKYPGAVPPAESRAWSKS